MEKPRNIDKKKEIARKAAEITLKRVGKFEDLSAPTLEEGDKLFKEKTRELWKHFAVQGVIGKEGLLPFAGDLDAKGSLYLLRQAGILSPKNFEVYERTLEKKQHEEHPRTELKYKKTKEQAKKTDPDKPVKVISFVPAGDVLKGAIHLDTGNKEGIVTEEDATAYFDHHGAESDLSSSATKKLYEGLTALGMIEKDPNLEKMTEFITQIDNGTFPHAETYFPVFHKTALGLQRFISPEALYKLFKDNRKPTHLLSDKELESYGLKKDSVRQKELEEKCKKEIVKLKEEGFVVDTKAGGKALISVGRRWPGDYLAAKYFKCDTYIIWSPEQQSFFVSNNEDGLEFDLPQGVNVRGKMWIKPRTDGKPLEISLKDILGRIAPPDFKPQGKLAEYLESEQIKSYNAENMNPEGPTPIKKESVDSKEKKLAPVEGVTSAKPETSTADLQAALAPQNKPIEEAEREAEKLWTPLDAARENYVKSRIEFSNDRKISSLYWRFRDLGGNDVEGTGTPESDNFLNEHPELKKYIDDFSRISNEYSDLKKMAIDQYVESKKEEFINLKGQERADVLDKILAEAYDQEDHLFEELEAKLKDGSKLAPEGETQAKPIEEPEIEAVKLLAPEPESKKEAIPEKSRIEIAREAYLAAKSEVESRKTSLKESTSLTDEDVEANFTNSPIGKALMEKFNLSREEYFGARSEELGRVLEQLESEFKDKGMNGEDLAKEMKKASSAYLISEFKNLYDAQTEMLAAQKQETAATWIGKKIYEMGDVYRKMPLKQKLVLSAALIGSGLVAGSIGGTVGTALAAIAGGGHISQRILGGAGIFVGLEGGLKKYQEGEFNLKESAKFSEVSEKVVEGTVVGKKDELLAYLKSRDKDLESMGWAADKDVRDIEKSLSNRRYLAAGLMSFFVGSGAATELLSSAFNGLGLNEVMEKLSAKLHYSEVEPISGTENPASPAKIIEEVSKESRAIATIEKGGSVSQAARSFMESTGMSNEEFKQVWENSFVDVNGIKVPIKDISLVHEGDQVVLVRDAAGVGHFEVLDYAKDKVGIGTNQELYDMYETSGKKAPVWLEKAVSEDVSDAFKDNNLDANDARVIEFHYKHGSLEDQMAIQEKLMDKMALATSDARPFSEMFVKLSSSPEHATAMEQFSNHLAASGFTSQDSAEFLAIKNVTVGELLEKRGGSWFKDYFFPSELNDSNGEKVAKVSIKVQRKLAEYIRWQATNADKSLTVEKFLKKLS